MGRSKYTSYSNFVNKSHNSSIRNEHPEHCKVIEPSSLYVVCNFDKLFEAARKEVIGK